MSGAKIIQSLREAIEGDFARVTIEGRTFVQETPLHRAAPELLEALTNVRKLISEAAVTGFNCNDGDWAERLFASQQETSRAIAKATEVA